MVRRKASLRFEAEGAAQASRGVDQVTQSVEKLGKQGEKTDSALARGVEGLKGFTTQVLLIPQAIEGALSLIERFVGSIQRLVEQTFAFLQLGDAVSDAARAFEMFAGGAEQATALVTQLQEATDGEVRALELERIALTAVSRGLDLSGEQLAQVFKAVKQITDATGQEFVPALDAVTRGLAAGTASTLAAVLGVENLAGAELATAAAIDDTTKRLTLQQRQQAILNLLLEAAAKRQEEFGSGVATAGDAVSRLFTDIVNFGDRLAQLVTENEDVIRAVERLRAAVTRFLGVPEDLADSLGAVVAQFLELVASFIEALPALQDIIQGFRDWFESIAPVVELLTLLLGIVTRVITAVVRLAAVLFRAVSAINPINLVLDVLSGNLDGVSERFRALGESIRELGRSPAIFGGAERAPAAADGIPQPINVNVGGLTSAQADQIADRVSGVLTNLLPPGLDLRPQIRTQILAQARL